MTIVEEAPPLYSEPSLPSGVRPGTSAARLHAVERVIETMHHRFREPLSVLSLARIALFSPYHFDRFFGEITGVPPLRFLMAIRLQQAKRFLLKTQYSVTRISGEVGYNSLGTFTRQFTEYVGVTPSRFRRAAHEVSRAVDGMVAGAAGGAIEAVAHAPQGAAGRIFMGLFPAALPRGLPVSCAVLDGPGRAALPGVADGGYHLFAALLPRAADPAEALLCGEALRGHAGPVQLRAGRVEAPLEVVLRPAAFTDPPLLVALPFALEARARRA